MVCFMNPSWYRIVSVNRDTDWSVGRVPSALSMPSLGIAVGCQHSGPAGRLGDAWWCQVRFHLALDLPQWTRSAIPRLYGCFPSEHLKRMASFNAVWSWKETNKSWQDLAFQAFNDPKSINREASETTLLGVSLGGWNTLLTSGLFLGGGMMSWWFQVGFYSAVFCFLFRPFVLICHDHWCCRTTSRMLKRPYCGQEHWLPGRWPLFKTNIISKWWICHCYQLNTIQPSVHVVSSRNKVPNTCFLLFFSHYLWSKVSIYTSNNEASWKGRITIPHWRR